MNFLKMIEFLAGELAKAEELVKNQSVINAKLEHMTIEKDHWKEEALEYRNERAPEWWAQEKELKTELKETKEINSKINDKLAETRADYLSESDLVVELEEKIKGLNDKYSKAWATDFAYRHLKKDYDSIQEYYEERIAKLKVEITHFNNNK